MLAAVDTSSGPFLALAVVGTIAFAVSGAMAAAESGMDWLGASVLAVVVAIGGGTIRDLLIGEPVAWVTDEWPVGVALGTAVVVLVVLRVRPDIDLTHHVGFLASDAIGLGAFAVLGASIALEAGTSPFIAVFMGVITGVGGGVVRDVFTGQPPIVFVGQIYAVAGLVGAAAYVVLERTDAAPRLTVWLPTAVVVVIRGAAVRYDLHLPKAAPPRPDRSPPLA